MAIILKDRKDSDFCRLCNMILENGFYLANYRGSLIKTVDFEIGNEINILKDIKYEKGQKVARQGVLGSIFGFGRPLKQWIATIYINENLNYKKWEIRVFGRDNIQLMMEFAKKIEKQFNRDLIVMVESEHGILEAEPNDVY